MTRTGTEHGEIEVYHYEQDKMYIIEVKIDWTEDSGVWYDNNGEGCPSSLEWDYKIIECTDEEGNDGCNTDWITFDMIQSDLENILRQDL